MNQEKGRGENARRREEIFKDSNISKTKKKISENVGRKELVRRRKLHVAKKRKLLKRRKDDQKLEKGCRQRRSR